MEIYETLARHSGLTASHARSTIFRTSMCVNGTGGESYRAMARRKNTIETFARVVTIKILQTHNIVASLPDHCRVYSGTFLGFQADDEARARPDATILTLYANSLQSE